MIELAWDTNNSSFASSSNHKCTNFHMNNEINITSSKALSLTTNSNSITNRLLTEAAENK